MEDKKVKKLLSQIEQTGTDMEFFSDCTECEKYELCQKNCVFCMEALEKILKQI